MSLVLTVLLCSCGIPAQKQECFSVPENFVCDVFVTNGGIDYAGTLEKSDGKYTLTVTSPQGINGLTATYDDATGFNVSYGDSSMPISPQEGFFMKEIIEFIEDLSGDFEINCEKENGKYIIRHNSWVLCFDAED